MLKKTYIMIATIAISLFIASCGGGGGSGSSDYIAQNHSPRASNYTKVLDVDERGFSTREWKRLFAANDIDGDSLTIKVKTPNSRFGRCAFSEGELSYVRTIETKEDDIVKVEISDGDKSVEVSLIIKPLYWKKISAGENHTLAIKSDGTLWAWGKNDFGQLGLGDRDIRLKPTQVGSESNWKMVSAGYGYSAAIKEDGSLYTWGKNSQGELGVGDRVNKLTPTQVSGSWKFVYAGKLNTAAIKSDGSLWCWGANSSSGVLGYGGTDRQTSPKRVGSNNNWVEVAISDRFAAALNEDNEIYTWGSNAAGELGTGDNTSYSTPIQETTQATDWKKLSIGVAHIVALKNDGTLWAWGKNDFGQLGINNYDWSKKRATQITSALVSSWRDISAGENYTIAVSSDNKVYTWGDNSYGQLGIGNRKAVKQPVQEISLAQNWETIDAGVTHSVAINSAGVIYDWGDNRFAQLGNSKRTIVFEPVKKNSQKWAAVAIGSGYVLALDQNMELYAWGDNSYGELGIGNNISTDTPRAIERGTAWSKISAGYRHSLAIKQNDSKVYSWGYNIFGQLGLNSITSVNQPTKINNNIYRDIDGGYYHSMAIKNDAKLYSWGYNSVGELGLGYNSTREKIPREVTGGLTWKSLSAGEKFSVAIASNNKIYCWGKNDKGQLGDGTSSNRNEPTLLSGSNNNSWLEVSAGSAHVLAIKNNHTLWSWGSSSHGQLGVGSSNGYRRVASKVGNSDDWIEVAAGYDHSLALNADKELFVFGNNKYGQLGLGNNDLYRIRPTKLTLLSDVVYIAAGVNRSAAITEDGYLWEWGEIYIPTLKPQRAIVRR